jgi:hypothetical protein
MQMPSTFSAKDSKVLVAICFACQKTTPTRVNDQFSRQGKWQTQAFSGLPIVRK